MLLLCRMNRCLCIDLTHSIVVHLQGGFTAHELEQTGTSMQGLHGAAAGPHCAAPSLASSYRHLCHFDAQTFPPDTQGTGSGAWASLMPSEQTKKAKGPAKVAPHLLSMRMHSTQASQSSMGAPEVALQGGTATAAVEMQ